MPLPECFVPDALTRGILERVRNGSDVRHEVASPLIRVGLISVFVGPTSRSGYELTKDGAEALKRW